MKTKLLLLLALFVSLTLTSCVTKYGTATPGYYKPASMEDPDAVAGVLVVPTIDGTK